MHKKQQFKRFYKEGATMTGILKETSSVRKRMLTKIQKNKQNNHNFITTTEDPFITNPPNEEPLQVASESEFQDTLKWLHRNYAKALKALAK